jgi:YegS/Rv2252/BmrU family lipid kinase
MEAPTAKLIVNPYAGRWKARDNIPRVRAAFEQAGIPYDLVVTERADEGIDLAMEAACSGFNPVVAVGGDSTCGEVVNGLVAAAGDGPTVPMGIIPLGTANDLAFGQGIPTEVEAAVHVIGRGQTRIIDVGRVNGRYFANNSALGLEPEVTLENARLVRVKGTLRYLLAALICIGRNPRWRMTLEWDGQNHQGPIVLVSVGNHRRTGGIFFMTPEAVPDDGLLDFVIAPVMGRLRMLRLLPMTFSGSHVRRPEVVHARARRLHIACEPGTPIQADGEVFELAATQVLFEVVPGKLTVLVDR